MSLQIIRCYWRLTYRRYIKINNEIRPYSYISDKEKNKASLDISKSKKFPDYQVVYVFPYIGHLRALNVVKQRTTILTGVSIPVIMGLQVAGLIQGQETIELIRASLMITVWCHVICYLCNNFVGSVYLNKDKQEVIISYLNYWGKRIDLTTNINSVIPVTETPRNMFHFLYRNLSVISPKKKLKINIRYGRIMEETDFENIVGDVS